MTEPNRRTFLGMAGMVALAGRSVSAAPSEKVRLGVIELSTRGTDLTKSIVKLKEAEIVAVCDIDDAKFANTLKVIEKAGPKEPRKEKDYRKLLDDKSIDAIVVATPDHWYAL